MSYRPHGRSSRSTRAQNDNDVFEGLPVKQWGQLKTHVSLAAPKSESESEEIDKWVDPPMPRDFNLLQPWTQQLLRLARSGKVGTKRKYDPEGAEDEKPEDETAEDAKISLEERGYVARRWKVVPEAMHVPEHKHFEFLAKRRKGLSNFYSAENQSAVVPLRKTKVQKASAEGEITVYEVLVPEGRGVEGEVTATSELADVKPVAMAPGTVVEGVGIANEQGVLVAEHLKPSAPRRNRPPPKKKGGPGRGKKRVTFTNPDGSTYTKIVPNATKIVPQPGQIVKHVAKGEEATADVTAEQAAKIAKEHQEKVKPDQEDGEDDEGDDGDDDDEDDEDREEGEISEEESAHPDANLAAEEKPVPTTETSDAGKSEEDAPRQSETPTKEKQPGREASSSPDLPIAMGMGKRAALTRLRADAKRREPSTSPDVPLAQTARIGRASLLEHPELQMDGDKDDLDAMDIDIPSVSSTNKATEVTSETSSLSSLGDEAEKTQAAADRPHPLTNVMLESEISTPVPPSTAGDEAVEEPVAEQPSIIDIDTSTTKSEAHPAAGEEAETGATRREVVATSSPKIATESSLSELQSNVDEDDATVVKQNMIAEGAASTDVIMEDTTPDVPILADKQDVDQPRAEQIEAAQEAPLHEAVQEAIAIAPLSAETEVEPAAIIEVPAPVVDEDADGTAVTAIVPPVADHIPAADAPFALTEQTTDIVETTAGAEEESDAMIEDEEAPSPPVAATQAISESVAAEPQVVESVEEAPPQPAATEDVPVPGSNEGEEDLLGNLQKNLAAGRADAGRQP